MDNCCVNIRIKDGGVDYHYSTIRTTYEDGSSPSYTADLGGTDVTISYNTSLSRWEIYNDTLDVLIYFSTTVDPMCPASDVSEWTNFSKPDIDFLIYEIPCEPSGYDVPGDSGFTSDPEGFPCTNCYLIKKKKRELSSDIMAISKREIFGLNCGPEWETIFKKSIIIHALECNPVGVYSENDEQCLIGKLNEKCNC